MAADHYSNKIMAQKQTTQVLQKTTFTLSDKTAQADPWEDYLWNHNQSLESLHFSVETNGLYITS